MGMSKFSGMDRVCPSEPEIDPLRAQTPRDPKAQRRGLLPGLGRVRTQPRRRPDHRPPGADGRLKLGAGLRSFQPQLTGQRPGRLIQFQQRDLSLIAALGQGQGRGWGKDDRRLIRHGGRAAHDHAHRRRRARHVKPRGVARDCHPKRARTAIQLFHRHRNPRGLRLGQNLGRDLFGQRLDKIVAPIGQCRLDRLRQHVIGQDVIDMIVRVRRGLAQFHIQIEAQPLCAATLGLKCANIGGDDQVFEVNAIRMFHTAIHSKSRRQASLSSRLQFEATR